MDIGDEQDEVIVEPIEDPFEPDDEHLDEPLEVEAPDEVEVPA